MGESGRKVSWGGWTVRKEKSRGVVSWEEGMRGGGRIRLTQEEMGVREQRKGEPRAEGEKAEGAPRRKMSWGARTVREEGGPG